MIEEIDVRDLPEEQVKLIHEFVKFLKRQVSKQKLSKTAVKETAQNVVFATHQSNVIGRLTSEEIYDYL